MSLALWALSRLKRLPLEWLSLEECISAEQEAAWATCEEALSEAPPESLRFGLALKKQQKKKLWEAAVWRFDSNAVCLCLCL